MKYIAIFIIIILAGYGAIALLERRSEPLQTENQTLVENPDSVIGYISRNISDLSPEKETLGGNFYVTNITLDAGTGRVRYEDGHNEYVANFSYEYITDGKVSITRFELVEEEPVI